MSNSERTVIAGGLVGGLLLGGFLLRGGISADRTGAPTNVPPGVSPLPSVASTSDAEVEALKQRIAALERKQLEQRLAELEAETDTPAEVVEEQLESQPHAAHPVHKRAVAKSVPSREPLSAKRPEVSPPETTPPRKKPATEKATPGPSTLAYWSALNDVIARESSMRAPPPSVTAANAGGFVESRLQAGRFAAGAIRDLDTTGVDPDAVALGRELAAWYQEEVTNNERARSLLGSSSVADRKGAAGNSWRSSEEQHRKKCDDINRHGAELRTRLSRKYGLAFPPLN